jgi:dTDP-4-dehydrorhamnose reductase
MTAAALRMAVFGAGGQLGRAIARVGARRGATVAGYDRRTADITDLHAVDAAMTGANFDVVVNAAAYTAVDKAESEPDVAYAVNAEGTRNIAETADVILVPVIHISTDYVFDGTKSSPYVEDDPIAPLGAYGRSKAAGEGAFRTHADAVILRTAWLYGLEGANFVKTMLRLAAERDVVRVVNDQHGCPTFADDLADAILTIAQRLSEAKPHSLVGTYHLAATGEATWYEFAAAIFAHAADHGFRVPRLEPITTADYPTPARRPANSVLDCSKAKRILGVQLPHWRDGLKRMLDAHLATAEAMR